METWQLAGDNDWFSIWLDVFWITYDKRLVGGASARKGSRSVFAKAAKKHIKSKEKAAEVLAALRAQIRFFDESRRNGEWQPNFPYVSSWINQERWTAEIDSHSALKERAAKNRQECVICGQPAHAAGYDRCQEHFYQTEEEKQSLVDWLKVTNDQDNYPLMKLKTESIEQWRDRLRKHIRHCSMKLTERIKRQ